MRKIGLKILNDIAYAKDERMYHHYVVMMHNFGADMGKWVQENGPEHWANALFSMKRWDWMYSNPAESFNLWIGPLRECSIFQFMNGHVVKLTSFLMEKKANLEKRRLPVGDRIEEKICDSQKRSVGFGFKNSLTGEYTVIDQNLKQYAVKLLLHECSCLEWQMTWPPCPHAMVVLGHVGLNVYDMVDDWFKNDMQQLLLQHVIPLVHTHDEPSVEELVKISFSIDLESESGLDVPLPPITRRPRGRPKKKRIESQYHDKRVIHCSRCGATGHNRKVCKEPIPE